MKPINIKETYSGFLGIDNINDHTQIIKRPTTSFGNRGMPQVRLLQANNIDIHNDYHLSRCDGYSLVLSGAYTNVWSNNDICLAVNSKNLVQIHPDFSTTLLLANIGSNDIDYETVNDWVYFTNSTIIGKIKNGSITLLPSTNKEFKSVLPSGNIIRYFQGSIYVVNGNVIYISDVINKDIYDRRWGFYQIGTDITMFESVNDGFYVSDLEKVYFMKRTGSLEEVAAIPKFDLIEIFNFPVTKGTAKKVYNITLNDKKYEQAIIWVSKNYLCVGGDNGVFEVIKEDIYSVPTGRIGTSMYRKSGDLRQYITIIK